MGCHPVVKLPDRKTPRSSFTAPQTLN